ncbi:Pex12 amino terminal region-domain-containing protein [Staphylotrichum tortipilum]|uniref:Peroxisome assembly protein 12 n=1 Tax=Staphylotrichum tortipilum TaxID=2831512 RepID=A0AAN6RQX0_9PEZI|nr:Pex12 amino terminal region-domain-containing protein [Staphylotrichum longicolle]
MEFMTALQGGSFDEHKPSLFELLSEQQLAALLPPTLRYLLSVLTHRYPRHLLRVLNSFDELYALAALVVERHYLRTRQGSFTENFYGLKREKALAAEIPRAAAAAPGVVREALRLTSSDVWKNLLVMVGVPYLKRKLDEAFEVDAPRALLGAAYNQRPPAGAPLREKLTYWARWFLRNVYPSVNAAYYFALLAFNLAYLFDNSKYHSPFLWLIGTRVRRMGAADYRAIEALEEKMAAGSARRTLGARLLGGLSLALPTSIFALKFLEWWYASDFAKQLSRKAAENLDLPPPVITGMPDAKKAAQHQQEKEKPAEEEEEELDDEEKERRLVERAPIAASSLLPIYTVPTPASSDCCPICEDDITTAAACQTGIVYCFACIHKWLTGTHARQEEFMAARAGKWESGEGRCAVTGRRVLGGTEGLRRIMV